MEGDVYIHGFVDSLAELGDHLIAIVVWVVTLPIGLFTYAHQPHTETIKQNRKLEKIRGGWIR
jgi:hypothetical protein